jgi:hypothetical protein
MLFTNQLVVGPGGQQQNDAAYWGEALLDHCEEAVDGAAVVYHVAGQDCVEFADVPGLCPI